MNLYERFDAAFVRAGDAPALLCPAGEDVSYAQLRTMTAHMAGGLTSLGVGPGDRVLVQAPKTAAAVALYLACLKVGAVHAPLNTACTPAELAYFLADAEPAAFVCAADCDVETNVPRLTLDAAGAGSLADLAAGAPPVAVAASRADEDTAALVYTSGTTGRAKGAMLSHGNLAANARALCDAWGWRQDDVLLHALPIFHVHGLFVALHCAFLTGTPQIFLPRFDVLAVLGELPRATVMMGVPTFYTRLLQSAAFDAAACAGMRLFISGSAPLRAETFAAFEQRTGQRILERYGMSETVMLTSNPVDGERVAGSVGFALPGVEARVADADGRALPAGEIGGIEVRGPSVFRGYWRQPEKTREAFRSDGFFVTGDLGEMDGSGRLAIVGRSKDLVISGGYNVYPKEVETWLDAMPGVAEAAVFGVPHADFGEAVVAALVAPAPVGIDAVDAFLRGKLARYKQPKQVVQVAELPRNAMGKVQKAELRETYRRLFAQQPDTPSASSAGSEGDAETRYA